MKTIGKIFIGALVAVGAYALYVNWKKKQSAAATIGTTDIPASTTSASTSTSTPTTTSSTTPTSQSTITDTGFAPVATNPASVPVTNPSAAAVPVTNPAAAAAAAAAAASATIAKTSKPGYVPATNSSYTGNYANAMNVVTSLGIPIDASIVTGYGVSAMFSAGARSYKLSDADAMQGFEDALLKSAGLPIGYASFAEAKTA
jgi:hypothetical protein